MKDNYDLVKEVCLQKGFVLDSDEKYISSMKKVSDKINVHCKIHADNKLFRPWGDIKAGRCVCKKCKENVKRKYYSIEEKIQILYDNGFEYIEGNLSCVSNSVKLKRLECGHIIDRPFNNITRGNTDCPFCNGTVPTGYWNKETCQQWIDENNISYTILNTKKVDSQLFIQVHCGNVKHDPYWCSWAHFKNGTRCNECYYENNNRTFWTVEKAKELLSQYGYTMIDENTYISSHERVDCVDELGFKYPVSVHYITRDRTKFSLWRNNKYALDNIKRFCELYRPDYEFIDTEYRGNKHLHKFRYLGDSLPEDIDREFELRFGSFVSSNCGHPMLSKSKLEAKCENLLKKYNINYTTQKTFDDCRDKGLLRFDFYIELNGKRYCVETDGNQHEVPVPLYGGLEGFIDTQRRDKIKDDYCLSNNIKMIRIPEREFKRMEEILIKELELDEEV